MVRACHADGIPFVARGAGTGLSGGALPVAGGVVISVARMRRILEVDLDGRAASSWSRASRTSRSPAGRAARLLLRAGSLQPAGLHDRRQRGRELRRRTLPEARLHGQPRVRLSSRAVRRRARRARRQGPRRAGARPARRLRRLGGHARLSPCGSPSASSAGPSRSRRSWPSFDSPTRPAEPCRTSWRPASCPPRSR